MAPPKALLFDIGGVCVVSPFQAILDYERANNIPLGWINHAISRSHSNTGAWHRVERGEIPLDDAFFVLFKSDLEHPDVWRAFCQQRGLGDDDGNAPPPPTVDAKALFWQMMRISRTADPHMYPALLKLKHSGRFTLGALSNTVIFPVGIVDDRGLVFESGLQRPPEIDGTAAVKSTSSFWADTPHIDGNISAPFDVFVSSAHVGLRKPDPKIYALAVKELDAAAKRKGHSEGITAADVLFLDDIGQNLKAAKQAGMRTLKVDLGHSDKAVRALADITGLDLLGAAIKPNL